ncbi:hypothetical protein [Corynebacterium bovis]|nr:hypothetical protein [Corynebacterium bovis]
MDADVSGNNDRRRVDGDGTTAEPVLRHVQDDPGAPRVPWHVEVRRG